MNTKNLLLIGGLAVVGYLIYKQSKKPKAQNNADVTPPAPDPAPVPVIINLNRPKRFRGFFTDEVVKDYNTSKFATFAPAKVKIQPMTNEL